VVESWWNYFFLWDVSEARKRCKGMHGQRKNDLDVCMYDAPDGGMIVQVRTGRIGDLLAHVRPESIARLDIGENEG